MTISLTGASVDTGAPAPSVRAATPLISAAGINDQAAIARQQLPTAVPAPAFIAAYSANIPPQPKPPLRPNIAAPSSALAAQFIAQDAALSPEDLAIFVATKPAMAKASAEPAGDDYLMNMRIARGDVALASKPSQVTVQATTQEAIANAKLATTLAGETNMRSGIAQFASAIPALVSQFMRRSTLAQARGVSAYQLAEARNAASRTPVTAEAS
jgi:hypothetical protein